MQWVESMVNIHKRLGLDYDIVKFLMELKCENYINPSCDSKLILKDS